MLAQVVNQGRMAEKNMIEVYIETGQKKVFAGAVAWPGWSRSGKSEAEALQALAMRCGVVDRGGEDPPLLDHVDAGLRETVHRVDDRVDLGGCLLQRVVLSPHGVCHLLGAVDTGRLAGSEQEEQGNSGY